jgi:hypothetical protein
MKKVKKNTEKNEITKKNENERMMREQKDDWDKTHGWTMNLTIPI